ncbi:MULTISPECIES: efflux RND transporter periplasmic adaptor subunit [Rhodomicrobium]|uniref:efflux RND transporter periplasmic adaptor subunit n=1 Tax=Rhodomicrobium TaxID=1068 RepID=UPI000B4A9829|nr:MULTISPECIES: efflux RND transporter periplasmic adaptor subunit [Rhodomicrobium]
MSRSILALLILLALGAGGYYAIYGARAPSGAPSGTNGQAAAQSGTPQGGRRAAPVEVGLARKAIATDDLWSVGSLRSDESVQISSEVAGRIAAIQFTEGEDVKAGDVLVKLDDALAAADVVDMKARAELAQSNFERASALSRSGSGTERVLDEATSALATARAALQLAETRLSKLSITAPFPGRVGLRTLSLGAYATPGLPLVNLEKIDQLKLDFRVPETVLTQVSKDQEVELTVDAFPGQRYPGTIYAIDPQVDVNGRSLRIRARIQNPNLALRPGLFARVYIKGLEERPAVRVPEIAVVPRGTDRVVFTIVGGKAKENKVSVGRRQAGEVEILQGIEAGTQVVTSGQMNLRDGVAVEIVAGPARTVVQD